MRHVIIGAGPAGCFYSSKEKHDDIDLFEEHKEIGRPFSCSGVLTGSGWQTHRKGDHDGERTEYCNANL